MIPSQTEENAIKSRKKPWISLVLFVRNWTFQWVAAIPRIKKNRRSLAPE
jgi:hypothetical protein